MLDFYADVCADSPAPKRAGIRKPAERWTRAFALALRTARRAQDMKGTELARRAGMDEPRIARYEKRRKLPSLATISRLAKGLKISPQLLVVMAEALLEEMP